MTDGTLKVLHFSSHDEDCGVGKYMENYLVGMEDLAGVANKFFEVSPYETRPMSSEQLQTVLDKLTAELRTYDILHIQHEFGLYWFDQFKRIVETAKGAGKKVVVTVHLSPDYAIKPAHRGGFGPRSILAYLRARKHYHKMIEEHIEPIRLADAVIVHNEVTKQSLERFGVAPGRIHKLTHPVYDVPEPPVSKEIFTALNKKDGDIIFCITGFLHRYKGALEAVKALKFLPAHYKLALIGGVKADSDEVDFEDKITDLVDQLGLHERVYITGFVQDDDRLNALIRECDICVYPHDREYYSSLSSGSLNLAFANDKPAIAYPTESMKEVGATGAVALCQTFAYYELARELKRLDIPAQTAKSKTFAVEYAWPKMAAKLVGLYESVAGR